MHNISLVHIHFENISDSPWLTCALAWQACTSLSQTIQLIYFSMVPSSKPTKPSSLTDSTSHLSSWLCTLAYYSIISTCLHFHTHSHSNSRATLSQKTSPNSPLQANALPKSHSISPRFSYCTYHFLPYVRVIYNRSHTPAPLKSTVTVSMSNSLYFPYKTVPWNSCHIRHWININCQSEAAL